MGEQKEIQGSLSRIQTSTDLPLMLIRVLLRRGLLFLEAPQRLLSGLWISMLQSLEKGAGGELSNSKAEWFSCMSGRGDTGKREKISLGYY